MLVLLTATLASVGCSKTDQPREESSASEKQATETPSTSDSSTSVLARLRKGGLILAFRHFQTDQSQTDTYDRGTHTGTWDDCDQQRNLSAEGRATATKVGETIRGLEIPIASVITSPMCRTRESANLAFGNATISEDLVGRGAAKEQALVSLMTPARTGEEHAGNRVLMTHGDNLIAITDLTKKQVVEGCALVIEPGDGEFKVVAVVRPEDWAPMAKRTTR